MNWEIMNNDLEEIVQMLEERQESNSNWIWVLKDIRKAQANLLSYEFSITVKRSEPTYGNVSFIHEDLSKYDSLKIFAWEYGFVVPMKWGANKKVLKWENRIKYKKTQAENNGNNI